MNAERHVVVIVDDHELFARGLTLLLTQGWGDKFIVGGHTTRVEEAAGLVASAGANLAVIDLAMPPLGGVAAIRQVKKRCPGTRVLALSGVDDVELAEEALRVGADGFLSKTANPEALVAPLNTLAAGLRVLTGPLLDALLNRSRKPPAELLNQLDSQELRLWTLLGSGTETIDIAKRLLVSERTAKRMVATLLRKVGAANRIEAAALAGRYGLLEDGSSGTRSASA